ncbi:FAD-binding protein [Pseudophaeobacter leonis]|uniref:FAD-binding protein n=1 Tax=Pseudophaeobacter leonis TaxID=1144477 RepID=UPI0009F6E328|nr:FAD-binding protein [Pseudophaeobacter leonis]
MIPQSEAELADCIATAKGPLNIQGGGTRGFTCAGDTLTTRGLSGVELYEPGSLTLVAKAGTTVVELEALLASEGQRMAFEPMDCRGLLGISGEPTIGGAFAANSSGPRRIQGGAARDYLLGVRFIDGAGQVVKNGGRVMKNVTGYDLVKLMAGSHGTLGVLSEVSLKVLPIPEAAGAVSVAVADLATAVAALSAALGSPYDVTGAAYDPVAGLAHIRLEGFAPSVSYRCDRLVTDLARFGAVEATADTPVALWQGIRDVAAFEEKTGDVWRISVKPSDAPVLAPQLAAEALQFDWGGGLIWALVPEGTDLRARLARAGVPGHATLVRASAQTHAALGRFQPQVAPLERLSQGLRQKFDPRGVLNKGLMQAGPLQAGQMQTGFTG